MLGNSKTDSQSNSTTHLENQFFVGVNNKVNFRNGSFKFLVLII